MDGGSNAPAGGGSLGIIGVAWPGVAAERRNEKRIGVGVRGEGIGGIYKTAGTKKRVVDTAFSSRTPSPTLQREIKTNPTSDDTLPSY